MRWLASQNVKSVAIVAAADSFPHANAIAMAQAALDAGIRVTDEETLDKETTDFGAVLERLKADTPDQLVTILGPFTASFFKAYADEAEQPARLTLSLTAQASLGRSVYTIVHAAKENCRN
jgi:ABC-type branched-subunit amino acid transport system substrate-binding protein